MMFSGKVKSVGGAHGGPSRLPLLRFGLLLLALPRAAALLGSVIAHIGAAAAFVTLTGQAEPPASPPEPEAVMVTMVAQPAVVADEEAEAMPERADVVEPDIEAEIDPDSASEPESAPIAAAEPDEDVDPVADTVPVPLARPADASGKPERRKAPEPARARETPAEQAMIKEADLPELAGRAGIPGSALAYAAPPGIRRDVSAEDRWLGRLAAHLERRKRYPRTALSRRKEGTVQVRFRVGPDGSIVATDLVRSSGVAELDEEVLDLLRRASPAPKPPPDVNPLVTVPISFTMTR